VTTQASEAAWNRRREVLGDEYLAAVATEMQDGDAEFQEYLTSVVWTRWARDGLSLHDRSLIVLTLTAALGRMEEFRLHVRSAPRCGVQDSEIDELVMQLVAYCGAPAGVSARREVLSVRESLRRS
jgi:4-carboxymuconolactone decarboxylase